MQKLLGLACFRGEGPYDEAEESSWAATSQVTWICTLFTNTALCCVKAPEWHSDLSGHFSGQLGLKDWIVKNLLAFQASSIFINNGGAP